MKTTTLPVGAYAGQEMTTMFHGTSSRNAQLIVAGQRFKPSKDGMLGTGVYVTRDQQKAEGYRVHHPFGNIDRNPPLPSGDPDPGCILRFRARLGICKEFTTADPEEDFVKWHDEEVPEEMWTPSVREAILKDGGKFHPR